MKDITIAFVGGGNMARSLIGGLIADGMPAKRIWVADPDEAILLNHRTNFDVHTSTSNNEAVRHAQVVVLAIKPQIAKSVVQDLAADVKTTRPLVISIAAGIRESHLGNWLGKDIAIVRAMPNTPALVHSGATVLFANAAVNKAQKNLAESILRTAGMTLWLDDEDLMDAVTALSGSGPAYFFLIMEALENAGHHLGLPQDMARLLTLQTAFGAAKMALESTEGLAQLRQRVTSPGGTTERAIKVLQQHRLEAIFDEALRAAHQRSMELATIFGNE
jgi:pyrroline-5-carboxylate reductase